jgi:hypothetical protein
MAKPRKKRVRIKGNRIVVDSELPNLSEVMLTFAKPLLETLPEKASTEQVRLALHYASIAWNAPVIGGDDAEVIAEALSVFDDLPEEFGPDAFEILHGMVEERKTRYAHDRRFASVDVVETKDGWTVSSDGAVVD